MRAFAAPGYLLRDAKIDVRIVYTAFLFLVLIGMITMGAFEMYHIGPTPDRAAAYYRGGESTGQMTFPKTARELVEVTHFHAFTMGVVYLILAHLLLATGLSPRMKRAFIVLGVGGLAGDIVAPWLIRYASAGFAYLQLTAWLAEWVGFGAFVIVPIREMWFSNGRDEFPPE